MLRTLEVRVSRFTFGTGEWVERGGAIFGAEIGIEELLRLPLSDESLRMLCADSGRLRLVIAFDDFSTELGPDLPNRLLVLLLRFFRPVGGFGARLVFVPGSGILLGRRPRLFSRSA